MASTTSFHGGIMLATAMAVSGTVALLAFGIQKSTDDFLVNSLRQPIPDKIVLPRSCLSSGTKKEKRKKNVQFAADVVEPKGSSEEYRKKMQHDFSKQIKNSSKNNRMTLYDGILRDRVHHRVAYSD